MGSERQGTIRNALERLYFMLQGGRYTDCEFRVGTEQQKVVRGHKAILATASPVFTAMFFGTMAEIQTPIPVPDIQPATFKAMLEYLYTDDIKVSSLNEAFDLYYAAKKYILPNLDKICTSIESMLTVENVCQVYEFSLMFEEKTLMDNCFDFMNKSKLFFFKYLAGNPDTLKNMKLSTLATVMSLKMAYDFNALDFFELIKRYVKVQQKLTESTTNSVAKYESSSNMSSVCTMLNDSNKVVGNAGKRRETVPLPTGSQKKPNVRPLLEKIHFLTLTPEQFVQGPAISGLLTVPESYAILMNIISDKTPVPMPSGFSTFRRTVYYKGGGSYFCGWRYVHGNFCDCGRTDSPLL